MIFLSKYLILGKLRYTDCTTTFTVGAIPPCGNCNVDDFSIVIFKTKPCVVWTWG